ncbi:MAG: hypothetical protein EBQ85_00970 [Proteobacteria bacterium]|nr:hypothetical protein [Pseudomonadota bacterium]
MKKHLLLFAVIVYLPTTLLADAGSIANSIVDHSEKTMNQAVTSTGREFAFQEAGNNAATGAALAGATGAALTGAAVAQFLLGNWGVGGTLMGMAGMEFAQMAASSGVARDNGSRSMCIQNNNAISDVNGGCYGFDPMTGTASGPVGQSNNMSSQIQPELPASLDKYLAQAGVDPNLFRDALLSGRLTDGASVMEALGKDPSLVRESDMAKALELAQDVVKSTSEEMSLATPAGDVAKSQSTYQNKNEAEKGKDFENREAEERKSERKNAKSLVAETGTENELAGSANLLRNLFGAPTESFTLRDQGLVFEMYLKDQGLVKTRQGMNIFQIAKQNYRGFSKWRTKSQPKKSPRVATLQ